VSGARRKFVGVYSFLGAAAAAPLMYLAAAPCGLICAGCPLGGACLLPTPLVLGAMVVGKSVNMIRNRLNPTSDRLDELEGDDGDEGEEEDLRDRGPA
jgi:hypothetical protein